MNSLSLSQRGGCGIDATWTQEVKTRNVCSTPSDFTEGLMLELKCAKLGTYARRRRRRDHHAAIVVHSPLRTRRISIARTAQ